MAVFKGSHCKIAGPGRAWRHLAPAAPSRQAARGRDPRAAQPGQAGRDENPAAGPARVLR